MEIDNNSIKKEADFSSVQQQQAVPIKKRKSKINREDREKIIKRKGRRRYEEGEPKAPRTGYVRFMNEFRQKLVTDHPNKTAIEHTKMIAEEWNKMRDEEKLPYLKAADFDRAKYQEELEKYNKEKRLSEEANNKEEVENDTNITHNIKTKPIVNGGGTNINNKNRPKDVKPFNTDNVLTNKRKIGDDGKVIQIFTDEFLEHNKVVDSDLRILRKSTSDYEQQNSVLEKHIENMKFGIEKLENENQELEEKNRLLLTYLDKLKSKLVEAVDGTTKDNIEEKLNDLINNITITQELNKAKEIIRNLDLHIKL